MCLALTLLLPAAMFVCSVSTSLLTWVWIITSPVSARAPILPTSSTASYPAVAGLRLVGYTSLRRSAVVNSRINYCNTVLAGAPRTVIHGQATARVERGCARRHRDSEVWPRPGSLAWRPPADVHQALSDSSPVSQRPRSTVPVGLLCPGRRCWHSAIAAFQQPSTYVTGSVLMIAGPFQLPAPQSGTLSRILSKTRSSVQTVSDACLIHNSVDECS